MFLWVRLALGFLEEHAQNIEDLESVFSNLPLTLNDMLVYKHHYSSKLSHRVSGQVGFRPPHQDRDLVFEAG